MTNSAQPTPLTALLDRASDLIVDDVVHDPVPDHLDRAGLEPVTDHLESARDSMPDPTEPLVQAGWFVLQQLQVALGFTRTSVDVQRLVPDVLARARDLGVATPEAIGAAASLVDHVRTEDSRALARDIVSARSVLGDEAVLAGAAALIAAFSAEIADTLALDPLIVHDELRAGAMEALCACPATVGRPRAHSARTTTECIRRLAVLRAG